jgi:hypothetical protein
VVALLVGSQAKAGLGGRRFTTDDVFPLHDPSDKADVPTYQAYVTLAWLRSEDLVVPHGRQGYSLPTGAELAAQWQERWNRLAQR